MNMLSEEDILKVLEHFNRYHSPEATAKLVDVNEKGFEVMFCGSFVISCCLDEYFEDLKYDLLRITGKGVEVEEVRRVKEECYRVAYTLG